MKKTLYLSLCALAALTFGTARKAGAQTITSHYEYTNCSNPIDSFSVGVSGFISGQTIETFYGDGTSDINTLSGSGGSGYASFAHYYGASGVYTVKEVLISGGADVDSVTFTVNYLMCQDMYVNLFNDLNSNCLFDASDALINDAATVEVDSAGVPVDTISATWYIDYIAYGPVGTIYTFKVIGNPHGYMPSCPASGIVYDTVSFASPSGKLMAFACDPSACLDNAVYGWFSPGVTGAGSHIWVTSSSCTPVAATLTLTFSPKYSYASLAYATAGVTASASGNILTVNIPSVSQSTTAYFVPLFSPVGTLTLGDTVQSRFVLTPFTGDCDTANNTFTEVDTIRLSHDPNYKSVTPGGNITAGTTLQYTIGFENTGNDTAHNIHIMDTLSDNLDISTFKEITSTAQVNVIFLTSGGHNIVKFDFPNINLLDSSHHGLCDGMVAYTIKAKTALATGTAIDNRAGIYFDVNPVVMTNNVENKIGALTTSVAIMSNIKVVVYPNPVSDELTIQTDGTYASFTITNTIGQLMMTQQINPGTSAMHSTNQKVDVKTLPAGLYYLTLRGELGAKVVKFEKM